MPTSLSMNIMAETLWNGDIDFETATNDILSKEFGKNFAKVKEYLAELSKYNCAEIFRRETTLDSEGNREKLEKSLDVLMAFSAELENNIYEDEFTKNAWKKLEFHNKLYKMMIEYYLNFKNNESEKLFEKIVDFVQKNEVRFKDEFDAMYFLDTLGGSMKKSLSM